MVNESSVSFYVRARLPEQPLEHACFEATDPPPTCVQTLQREESPLPILSVESLSDCATWLVLKRFDGLVLHPLGVEILGPSRTSLDFGVDASIVRTSLPLRVKISDIVIVRGDFEDPSF